ncbi:MAG: hypothetical protein II956_12945, partial [Bacteroidales bacterium]|nr:hypothetical protein [Bacteroidales bacterium]
LEIFCQDYVSSESDQLLEFDDFEHRSEEFKELARPLQYAVSDPKVRKVMTIEDEMSIHFQNVKYVTDENEALHILVEQSQQKLQESRQQLQEKDSQLQKKDSQLQEQKSQLQEKDSQINAILSISVKTFFAQGMTIEEISKILKISVEEVEKLK